MIHADQSPTMTAAAWAMMLVLALLWGASFFFYKILVTALPPLTIALGRVVLAAVVLNLLLVVRGEALPRDRGQWRAFAVMAMLNNVVPFSLIAYGETRIASGMAAILNAMTPIFTVIAAHILTRDEKLTASKVIGVLFGFAGVAVLVGPAAWHGVGHGLAGEPACLAAALSYALAGLYGRRLRAVPPLVAATGQITAGAIILVPLALAVDRPWTLAMPGPSIWLALAGIAFLSTALAYVIYFRLLASVGATNLLLVTFLLPISALALGALFLGEAVTGPAVGGMLLIGLAFAAIDGRPWRAIVSRSRASG